MKYRSLDLWKLFLTAVLFLVSTEWLACKTRNFNRITEDAISGPETDLLAGYGYHSVRASPAQGECVRDAAPTQPPAAPSQPTTPPSTTIAAAPTAAQAAPAAAADPQTGMRLVDEVDASATGSPSQSQDIEISVLDLESKDGALVLPASAQDIDLGMFQDSRSDVQSDSFALVSGSLPGQSYSVELVTSETEMRSAVSISASVESSVPVISGGLSTKVKTENRDFSQYSYVIFKVLLFGDRSQFRSPTLTEYAQEGARSHNFAMRCGDRYVSGVRMGGVMLGVARINKVEQSMRREVEVALQNFKTNYAPRIQASGSVTTDQRVSRIFSSARVTLYHLSRLEIQPGHTIQSLLDAISSFAKDIQKPASQKIVLAYLREYDGVSGYQGGPSNEQVNNIAEALRQADTRLTEASRALERIAALSSLGQEGYADSRRQLQEFTNKVQQAITSCRRAPVNCDQASLNQTLPNVSLPVDPGTIGNSWRANNQYWIPLPIPDRGQPTLSCMHPQDGNKWYVIDGIMVTFRSTTSNGQADVQLRYYSTGSLSVFRHYRSAYHQVPIFELGPDIDRIVAQSITPVQAAELINRVFVQRTRGDGSSQISSCGVAE